MQEFFYQVSSGIGGFFDGLVNKDDQEQKNQELQSELEVFKSKSREYEELKKRTRGLPSFLNISRAIPTRNWKLARITGKNPATGLTCLRSTLDGRTA